MVSPRGCLKPSIRMGSGTVGGPAQCTYCSSEVIRESKSVACATLLASRRTKRDASDYRRLREIELHERFAQRFSSSWRF